MAVENWVSKQIGELTEFRRDLHRNPELLYDVERTAAKVSDALRAAGVDEVVSAGPASSASSAVRATGRAA